MRLKTKSRKIAYIEPYSGVSGDMFLAALIDLGFPLKSLQEAIGQMGIQGCDLKAERVQKKGIGSVRFTVEVEEIKRRHTHLKEIKGMIDSSGATSGAKDRAKKIFQAVARAEALVHGIDAQKVHFHEVGAVDSIVDILGAGMALDYFGFDLIVSAPVNTGSGTVRCDHGVLPVPAPATAELLKGVPCYSSGVPMELATPTGVAILTHATSSFGPLPPMKITNTGYGAGTADLPDSPNLLRIISGESFKDTAGVELLEMEANLDDMNPEYYQHVMELLFKAGAADVFLTPIIMKKGRPAIKLSVLCDKGDKERVAGIIFKETSTFGIRHRPVAREILERTVKEVKTRYGPVKVKIGYRDGKICQVSPEYESCARVARKKEAPLKDVFDAARQAGLRPETYRA